MAKKEFSKFFVASLKRTAQNVSPLIRRKQKLQNEVEELSREIEEIQAELDAYQAPFVVATGHSIEDLVERVVETTDKLDKDGKPVKITKWVLKYPETIVPEDPEEPVNAPTEEAQEAAIKEQADMVSREEIVTDEGEVIPPVFDEPLTIE